MFFITLSDVIIMSGSIVQKKLKHASDCRIAGKGVCIDGIG